jgi:hypothetical protein
MSANGKRVYVLAEYTVERRQDGWYFGRTIRYEDRQERRGPYKSVVSVTLVIARQLKREIVKRDAAHTAKA